MAVPALLLSLVVACAGAGGPPRGAAYTPTNSPEASTNCPREATAAKAAREAALGEDEIAALSDQGSPERAAAAKAVLALADCERRAFDRRELNSSDPGEFKAEVGRARESFYSVKTLYEEVVATALPEWVVAGETRLGDLHGAYADKLRHSDPGPLVAGDRNAWRSEVEDVAAPVEEEAAKHYDKAISVVEIGPPAFVTEPLVAPYHMTACAGLAARDAAAAKAHASCAAAH